MLQQLLLITQLHRSGGTLFSQLVDGHSGIKAHPHELFIGKPNKWDWPNLKGELGSADEVFSALQEGKIVSIGEQGKFIKPGSNRAASDQMVPFHYNLDHHRKAFEALYQQAPAMSQRLAIQLYLSSFFEAWPEFKTSGRERFISCFLPHILMYEDSMQRLFHDFPDLFLVSLLRRPDTWIASLVNHMRLDLNDTKKATKHLERWKISVKTILTLHSNPAIHTFATSYEALVSQTDAEMRRFCGVAGFSFEPILLTPTVGGFPVLPNSSYKRTETGVNQDSLRLREPLPEALDQLITKKYLPLYKRSVAALGIAPIES
jgi:hypothetical protein